MGIEESKFPLLYHLSIFGERPEHPHNPLFFSLGTGRICFEDKETSLQQDRDILTTPYLCRAS